MLVGGTTVLASGFHPGEVWDDVRACGAVGFAGAGAMVSMLQTLAPDPRDAQLPLRFISAAPIDAGVYRDIEKRYGCHIVTMYGLTEAFPIAVKNVADDGVPGTSGRPNPNFDVRIVDADGNPLPAGTVGEIACRPKYPHIAWFHITVQQPTVVSVVEGIGDRGDDLDHVVWRHATGIGVVEQFAGVGTVDVVHRNP